MTVCIMIVFDIAKKARYLSHDYIILFRMKFHQSLYLNHFIDRVLLQRTLVFSNIVH